MSYLRSLDPGLSPAVWTLQAGNFANAFGNGMVSAYLLIYLHNVRTISLGTAGLCLATMGVAALAVGPVVGALVDRVGALALERRIPQEIRRTPRRVPVVEVAA